MNDTKEMKEFVKLVKQGFIDAIKSIHKTENVFSWNTGGVVMDVEKIYPYVVQRIEEIEKRQGVSHSDDCREYGYAYWVEIVLSILFYQYPKYIFTKQLSFTDQEKQLAENFCNYLNGLELGMALPGKEDLSARELMLTRFSDYLKWATMICDFNAFLSKDSFNELFRVMALWYVVQQKVIDKRSLPWLATNEDRLETNPFKFEE